MTIAALVMHRYLLLGEFLLGVCKAVNAAFPKKDPAFFDFQQKCRLRFHSSC